MKLQVMSDLHREMYRRYGEQTEDPTRHPDADVVILAGDIDVGLNAREFVARLAEDGPVIYVPGNHELYGHERERLLNDLEFEIGRIPNAHFFHDGTEAVEIKGVRFIGATLWTKMTGATPERLRRIGQWMNDFHHIRIVANGNVRKMLPSDTVKFHLDHRRALTKQLAEAKRTDTPVVVVTHHSPSKHGECPVHSGGELSPAYWTDLHGMIHQYKPVLWLHGHTHHKHDTVVGETRIVSNPRGYPGDRVQGFDPNELIEVSPLDFAYNQLVRRHDVALPS